MTEAVQAVIVGAGPAGVRAAQALVAHGVRPLVIDEGFSFGGQIYRRQPEDFRRPAEALYGYETQKANSVHSTMSELTSRIDYRPETLVWNAEQGALDLMHRGEMTRIEYTHLIIASGATERMLPVEGWTRPGVYGLGGAQVALKFQGCAIGANVVFAGTGPLLYLVAYQYAKAGARVTAVLDTATFGDKASAISSLLARPATFAKGLYYTLWLRMNGVSLHEGASVVRVKGDARVRGITWHDGNREREIACDAVGLGYGLRPETQLADLLGCAFRFDSLARTHLPERDAAGRTSVKGVYVAGDGAGISGADAAEWAGERAGLALLEDAGLESDPSRARSLEIKLLGIAKFRAGLERAFPFPRQWASRVSDEVTICRCEEVTAGELRNAIRETGAQEINRLKALARVGMGRCQGRMCGAAACEILAHACGKSIADVGRLRAQPPVKPIPFGAGA